MSNLFYGTILIILSLLPGFTSKTNLEEMAKGKLLAPQQNETAKKYSDTNIQPVPEKIPSYEDITVGAKSAVFIDVQSGEILFEKNINQKLPMASTTKLMTALITYENLKQDQVVTVPPLAPRPLDSVMGLSAGQKFKVSEIMHGLLIESGSDAAQTLAVATAGDEHKFVAMMNEKAALFGLTNTQFTNSVGYDDDGNYSTSFDLSKLARVVAKNKVIMDIAGKSSYVAISEDGQKLYLTNTNKLLGGEGYKGLKTGTTLSAGECLITYYENGEQKIIGVILASPSRFTETNNVIQWIRKAFRWSDIPTKENLNE